MTDHNRSYADACDSGQHFHDRVVVEPLIAIADGIGGVSAGYRCPRCGHEWTCSWGEVPGRVLTPGPRRTSGRDAELVGRVHELAAINRAVKARNNRGVR